MKDYIKKRYRKRCRQEKSGVKASLNPGKITAFVPTNVRKRAAKAERKYLSGKNIV